MSQPKALAVATMSMMTAAVMPLETSEWTKDENVSVRYTHPPSTNA